jgi:hypothetical protein
MAARRRTAALGNDQFQQAPSRWGRRPKDATSGGVLGGAIVCGDTVRIVNRRLSNAKRRALNGVCHGMILFGTIVGVAAQRPARRITDYGIPQVKRINADVRKVWDDNQLRPSAVSQDGSWCRRVYLDILGRIPSVDELTWFTSSRSATKRKDLVELLLDDEQYLDEYARNWTTIWTNILIGRSGGTERNSLTSRPGMQEYLRDSFARNKPYDKMVEELVTATGSNAPGTAEFNGAVNFLAMKVNDEDGTLATAATARIFMGLQVQCTQCHNHPFNSWKQQKFWELNAFFRQTRTLRRFQSGTRNVVAAALVNEDFAGQAASRDPKRAAIFYELRNGLLKVAYPVFVDGTEIDKSGYVQKSNRRDQLGKLLTASHYIDKMLVNRYWAHFFGYGFTQPIDDMGPHNPPSHPELVDYLAGEVRDGQYDLKDLIRWITLSEAYSLSSRMTRHNEQDDPKRGQAPLFSHFYLRQMRAEELYESLLVATKAGRTQGDFEEQERAKATWLRQFVTAFGNDEGEETTTFNGTIPQALMMFNGEMIRRATGGDRGSFLSEVTANSAKARDAVQRLFWAGLSRKPTREEFEMANQLMVSRSLDQYSGSGRGRQPRETAPSVAGLQDLWWAILNSNEFILNH